MLEYPLEEAKELLEGQQSKCTEMIEDARKKVRRWRMADVRRMSARRRGSRRAEMLCRQSPGTVLFQSLAHNSRCHLGDELPVDPRQRRGKHQGTHPHGRRGACSWQCVDLWTCERLDVCVHDPSRRVDVWLFDCMRAERVDQGPDHDNRGYHCADLQLGRRATARKSLDCDPCGRLGGFWFLCGAVMPENHRQIC